ncbi:MAG: hypothetical protein AAGC85_27035, partial [Bacteroidota bacterium]
FTTGAMEFSIKENEVWDFNLFRAFIHGSRKWLIDNHINFEIFHKLLLVNCCRFTAHLLNLEQDELLNRNEPSGSILIEENPYVIRYGKFQEVSFATEMKKIFESEIASHGT